MPHGLWGGIHQDLRSVISPLHVALAQEMQDTREDVSAGTGHAHCSRAAQAPGWIWPLLPGLQNQTNQLIDVQAFLPVGFEYPYEKAAQEVPLLLQGSALILFHTEIRLGRYQPQDLFMGLGPRLTKPQHPPLWKVLSLLQC